MHTTIFCDKNYDRRPMNGSCVVYQHMGDGTYEYGYVRNKERALRMVQGNRVRSKEQQFGIVQLRALYIVNVKIKLKKRHNK